MFWRKFNHIIFTFLSRITRPTQFIYATVIVGCFFDSLYFIAYSSFVRSNSYTVLHLFLDVTVAFVIIIYFIDAVPRDLFLIDVETLIRPYLVRYVPNWVFGAIDVSCNVRKNRAIRAYFLSLFFFIDCTLITIKILYFGCLVYFRIHFLLSFILFVFFLTCLRTLYRTRNYDSIKPVNEVVFIIKEKSSNTHANCASRHGQCNTTTKTNF